MLLYFLPGLALTLVLAGCNSTKLPLAHPSVAEINQTDATNRNATLSEASINQLITIHGRAENASLGAIVLTQDETPVYMDGIQEWHSDLVGKMIIVTGILRRKSLAPKTLVSPNGEVSHGIDGESYVLDNSTWKIDRTR
ncbi:MAG: hypothetical protein V7K94_16475 [Nostoc sp.]|uniref:hypothetical protein n=1 Tax=Nostoc sp. TaxID=1180 RepID=UPI002FF5307A